MIGIAWSAATPWKTWVVWLAGQLISRPRDAFRAGQADGLLQGVGAEAAAGRDEAVNRAGLRPVGHDLDAGAEGGAVGLPAESLTVSQWFPWPGFWKRML